MADVVSIPQNLFYIIIAVIVVVGLIVVFMQWRRVREANSNVQFLEKQAELRKIELVEKDLESKRIMENVLPLPKEKQERLYNIRKNTTEILNNTGYLHSEINERVTHLEARTEYLKLQKLLSEIEKKEMELDKKTKNSGKSDEVQSIKGITGGK
jgi:Flp pilus assembly protein TadB